jgi:PKD repeat protein
MKALTTLLILSNFWLLHSCESGEEPVRNEKLTVYFQMEHTAVKVGSEVTFTSWCNYADSYLWDFGDGGTSTEQHPIYTYLTPGVYTVGLVCTHNEEEKSFSSEIQVKEHEIKVMSYNIAFSAGAVEDLYPMWERDGHGFWNRDRRTELAEIINSIDPDILGLQEAWCWDSGDPQVYVDFAKLIGMEYYHYPGFEEAEWNGLCIFSKFPIHLKAKIYHQPCVPDMDWNGLCLLGAQIDVDSANVFDFFSCHLVFQVEGTMECEMESIHDLLLDEPNPNTILLGDMNWRNNEHFSGLLKEAGLLYVHPTDKYDSTNTTNIDQIWVSKSLYEGARSYDISNISSIFNPDMEALLNSASDHYPVVGKVLY